MIRIQRLRVPNLSGDGMPSDVLFEITPDAATDSREAVDRLRRIFIGTDVKYVGEKIVMRRGQYNDDCPDPWRTVTVAIVMAVLEAKSRRVVYIAPDPAVVGTYQMRTGGMPLTPEELLSLRHKAGVYAQELQSPPPPGEKLYRLSVPLGNHMPSAYDIAYTIGATLADEPMTMPEFAAASSYQ